MSFRACVSLLIFCLGDLSIDSSGVLKSSTVTVLLSISPFVPVSMSYILICPVLGLYVFTVVITSRIDSLIIM